MKLHSPFFKPHPCQEEILNDPHRFKVVSAGRRFGKGNLALRQAAMVALNKPGSRIWFISPTYRATEPQWEKALQAFKVMRVNGRPIIGKPKLKQMRIPFYNGSAIDFKSADNPISLLGAGDLIHFVIMDEAAYIQHAAWKKVRPILMDNQAPAIFISTPNDKQPKNWFFDLFMKGQEHKKLICDQCGGEGCEACNGTGFILRKNPFYDKDYKSWQFSSYDNPFIPDEEIDALIREERGRGWTDLDVRREIYGEFVGGEGATFNLETVRDCVAGDYEPYIPGKSYVMGVDLGRAESFTVIVVMRLPDDPADVPHIVLFRRFQGPWPLQVQRIAQTALSYSNPHVFLDATGLGDPLKAQLRAAGVVRLHPIKLSGTSKPEIVEALIAAIESRGLTWPDNPQFETELLNLETNVTNSGQVQYKHAKGYTDDMVMATALAWWGYHRVANPLKTGLWVAAM